MQNNWLDGEQILKAIGHDSRIRREKPFDFFCEFLQDIWMDNTAEEALVQWGVKAKEAPLVCR